MEVAQAHVKTQTVQMETEQGQGSCHRDGKVKNSPKAAQRSH